MILDKIISIMSDTGLDLLGEIDMKVGIIVYSQTGNTYQVAEKLERQISSSGHNVKLDRITIEGKPSGTNIKIDNRPEVGPYDIIIFGAPVQGFSLAVVMKKYLEEIGDLKGKRVHLFTTKGMSNKWSGGNGTIKKMTKLTELKGAKVGETGIIFWKEKHRERMTNEVIARISRAI
jgi:flavodoxin